MKRLITLLLTMIMALTVTVTDAIPPEPSFIFSTWVYFYNFTPVSNQFMVTSTQTITNAMTTNGNANWQTAALGFATGTCGSEIWGTSSYTSSAVGAETISAFGAAGKYYIVSTGGAADSFKCANGATLLTFVNKFYGPYMRGLDFDIETPLSGNTLTQTDVNNLVQSAQYVSHIYPQLRISFTVGWNSATAPLSNPGTFAQYVMNALATYPINNYSIDLETGQYGSPNQYYCVLGTAAINVCNNGLNNPASCQAMPSGSYCAMGLSAIRAVESFHNTYNVPYPNIEISQVFGNQGVASYVQQFTLDDMDVLTAFAISRNLGGLRIWSVSRDRDCVAPSTNNGYTESCNSMGATYAGVLGYTNRALAGLHPSTPSVPTIGSGRTNPGGLAITTTSCPAASQNKAYVGCTITASGGTPPYTFGVYQPPAAGTPATAPLPEGMSLNPTTGQITAPVVGGLGYYATTIQVTDSASPNNYATKSITWDIPGSTAWLANIFPAGSIFHHRIDAATCGSYCPVDTSPAATLNCYYTNDGVWASGTSYPQGVYVGWGAGSQTIDFVSLTAIASGGAHPHVNSNWAAISSVAFTGTVGNSTTPTAAGNVLNVTAMNNGGVIYVGMPVVSITSSGLTSSTTVSSFGTGSGGVGSYYLSTSGGYISTASPLYSGVQTWSATTSYTAGQAVAYGTYNYVTAYFIATGTVPVGTAPPAQPAIPAQPVSSSYWTMQAPSPTNCSLVGARVTPAFGNIYAGNTPDGMSVISVPWNQPFVRLNTISGYTPGTGVSSGPIPSWAPIEFTSFSNSDRHTIVYQPAGGSFTGPNLYEQYLAVYTGNSWSNYSMGYWPNINTSYSLVPNGATSASALNIAVTLAYPEEVIGTGTPTAPNGAVNHPLRLTMLNYLPYYVWPASGTTTAGQGTCSTSGGPITVNTQITQSSPPVSCTNGGVYGEIYRLKNSVYTAITSSPSTFGNGCFATSPQATIIMTGIANYGIILADGGYDGQVSGTPDSRWNDIDLKCIQQITLNDLEPVNTSALIVSNTSAQTAH